MSQKIFLADDSVTIQKVIELTFMDGDYEVVSVSSGDEALERLAEEAPDIVISDVHMPGASGFDVARKSKEIAPRVPVLLLVGTFEPYDKDEAGASGADGRLKKPFDSQELIQAVENLLSQASVSSPPAAADPPETVLMPTPGTSAPDFQLPEEEQAEDSDDELEAVTDRAFSDPTSSVPDLVIDPPAETATTDVSSEVAAPSTAEIDEPWSLASVEADASPTSPTPPTPVSSEPSIDLDDDVFPVLEEAPPIEPAVEDPLPANLSGADGGESSDAEPVVSPFGTVVETNSPAVGEENTDGEEPDQPPAATPEPLLSLQPDADLSSNLAVAEEETPDDDDAAAPPPQVPETTGETAPAEPLSDEDVERIARRVSELVGQKVSREVAWEVIPDLAEIVIKDRIRELEGQIESTESSE